jgi:hypothetical protein
LRDARIVPVASTLYAVGGLYGNTCALAAIRERARREPQPPTIIFNGDFNFFNAEPRWWRELNEKVRDGEGHAVMAGNVEVESSDFASTSCGCGYPSYVSAGVVERSDRIVGALRSSAAAAAAPDLVTWLQGLPKALVAEVGEQRRRVGVVHGDVESLAGWQLGIEAMEPPDTALRAALGCTEADGAAYLPITPRVKLLSWFADAQVSGLLCTHTCLPFGQIWDTFGSGEEHGGAVVGAGHGRRAVFNNGSAGMANFSGTTFGLITRVSADLTVPSDSMYGGVAEGLRYDALPVTSRALSPLMEPDCMLTASLIRYDALPVHFDTEAWLERFGARWPEGSDAHLSYYKRIVQGPGGFTVRDASRHLVEITRRVSPEAERGNQHYVS